jgi:hypothetical protein
MDISKMSVASKQYILDNWVDMYTRCRGQEKNGVIRQCTSSFPTIKKTETTSYVPGFPAFMRVNLKSHRVDEAFALSMREVYFGKIKTIVHTTTPVRHGKRR